MDWNHNLLPGEAQALLKKAELEDKIYRLTHSEAKISADRLTLNKTIKQVKRQLPEYFRD